MSERKTVRNSAADLIFGIMFLAFAVIVFVKGFSSDNKNEFYEWLFYGLIAAVTAIAVIVMFFMVKYEYDENGFVYTNPLGKKREISYNDIFGITRTNKNSLRLDLRDGSFISISTSTKAAKEFASVLEQAYIRNSQQNAQPTFY